ncbi:VCBS domain-containing protein [Pseudomonas entomophila]|uniref:VCBS domain-containing protein n=1 Tax=Pseudomonas entomophila TaxID=312306 RepID=UPI001F02FABE|nr:VCBS domain-containing protein [Pseudomonas entomophila]MCG8293218.1 VCBS domain-containing protein [Pseudomonas entomophila]
MPGTPRTSSLILRPKRHTLALEPRILFDGAAATAAVDTHQTEPAKQGEAFVDRPPQTDTQPTRDTAPSAARSLLVLDSRIENREQLLADRPGNVTAIVVNKGEDGLAAISAALAQLGKVDAIQVVSHGAAGQFTLGNRTVTADNVGQFAQTLQQWRGNLNEGADIQLYGCDIGAGAAGRTLVSELARWTAADVGASDNATGASGKGGDWVLETRVGNLDQPIALSEKAMAGYDSLLADAAPTVSLPSAGSDVLLGDTFSFTVNFSNTSNQAGYAPFINLFMPSTGKDGDDGVRFVSASYLGQNLVTHAVTFDAAGNASHPLAKDASGNPVIISAAAFGLRAGDQLVVVELPFASVTNGQPVIPVQVTASLSNLADTNFSNGSPDLNIRASGGFQFGNDALDNPLNDPSLIASGASVFVVHPTVITLDQTLNTPEGETATGPNYGRTLTVTVTPAPGQTLTHVVVTQPLPDNVQVTAITPGAGGRLTSITLQDGTVVSDPATIASLIAADDVFISNFTVEYDSLAAATDTVVAFYVPETDANGRPVLDPVTGNAVTINLGAPTAAGEWVPLDPRDVTTPGTSIDFTGTGDPTQFIAKSITLLKDVSLQTDLGQTGIGPGDTLRYTLNLAISDYFAFGRDFFNQGQLVIRDQLSDGQTFSGTPTMTVTLAGVPQTIALVTSVVTNADGTTSMVFDIAQSLRNAFSNVRGWLNGDLAFDQRQEGAVIAIISYAAVVGQAYTPPAGSPHGEINEGDELGNSAVVEGTLLQDIFNLTGQRQTDDSTSTSVIPTRNVDIKLVEVNNGTPPASGELRPGDEVTFELSYDLVTGDYEQFKLTAYLPLPLFDVSGVSWSVGGDAGQWQIGPGNTNAGAVLGVSNGPGNSVVFDFGSHVTADTNGSRIVVRFTLRVGDQPFADQRSLDVLAQSSQQTTLTDRTLISSDVVAIVSIAEPVLAIKHGVVSGSNGTVTGSSGSWNPPGSGVPPFNGSITSLAQVDGNISGIDGGDRLRLVTAIENSGGGGAYDVVTSISLPPGLSFVGGSLAAANLQIYRGDGSALVAGVDYSVNGQQITFLDANDQATLLAGRAGTAADQSGANLVVISYDVVVSASIEAGRSLQTSATLSNYASVNGGTDFTPADLSDIAAQQVTAPVIGKTFAGGSLDDGDSSASHTRGSDLVVGESMRYDIIVTLPEGITQTLRIEDLIPPGMRLDTGFNNGLGYQLITTRAGSAALAADFAGNVVVSAFTGVGGALGADGVDARWTFSAAGATADNRADNNSFVIRVQLVTNNVMGNQANRALQNSAQLTYSDPDGDTPNGSTPVERNVALSGGAPIVTLREPTLQVVQTLTSTAGPGGYDQGDTVTFTITLRNGAGNNDFDAFDISFLDNLPTQLNNVRLTGVLYQGGATNNGGVDFEIVGGQLRSASGANIDIAKGGSIVLSLTGVVNASAASLATVSNLATVQWTSLDGAQGGERSGVDGLLDSGVLNDYRNSSLLLIPVAQAIQISRVGGLPDTAAPSPTTSVQENVTIGEVIRYRVVVLVPEGNNPNYQVQITLANGLRFISPDALANALRIGFISDGGLTSDANLIVGGSLNILGNEHNPEALPITPDLSGLAPSGIFDPSRLSVVSNPDGSQVITFNLGNLVNGAGSDSDLEGVVLEFNVRVANQASNASGALLGVHANEIVNGLARASSDTLFERIVEPSFTGLDKHIVGFDPNPGGTSGTATVQVNFTQNGGLPAFDAQLRDGFASGSNYSLLGISIDGVSYGPGNLPSGVSFGTSGGLTVDFAQLDVGAQVSVRYQVTLPNGTVIAASDATLTWTSLPEAFTGWGGSAVGSDGSLDGERTGSTVGPNQYILRDSAGLGLITGTLWDDTGSATTSTTPDGPGLAGQTVTLTWAGLDGRLDTTADNLQFSTVTDGNGRYHFGTLPLGVYRIDAPIGVISYPQPLGDLRVRIDSDGGTLGQIFITLGDADTQSADAGYVEQNDAPVNTLPGTQHGLEDVPLAIAGISVADRDVERNPNAAARAISVTLSVLNGTLSLTGNVPGVTVTGANSASLSLTGTLADVNSLLATLRYLGNLNFNGTDTLTVHSNDLGNYGDADGDGIPGTPGDALTDTDSLQIILDPVNDTPLAIDDNANAVEAGGTRNSVKGIDPRGNLLANDSDVDIATNGDRLRVISVGLQDGSGLQSPVNGLVVITGQYGRLIVASSGAYQYIVDNDNPQVEALRLAGQTLTERFDYRISDLAGATAGATLTVTLHGANDTPLGVDDEGVAVEAGGVANGTPGSDAVGNVLDNDRDVDSPVNGESKSVTGIRAVAEAAAGPFTNVTAGTTIAGLYGSLTINPDGSYRYVVNNSHPVVQALSAGQQLSEVFSYRLTDAGGLNDVAQLRITLQGANDNPVASDDQAVAQASNGSNSESNPSGNVILFPSRPGTAGQPGGNGIDTDVDQNDRPGSKLRVDGVINKPEAGYNPLTDVLLGVAVNTNLNNGTVVVGQYGTLRIGADGSWFYDVDSDNTAVKALPAGQALTEYFTYRVVDTAGLSDTAQLVITVRGVNDPPVAHNVVAVAVERGGVGNQTPGIDPSGNVTVVSSDPDGNPISVTQIRFGGLGEPGTPVAVLPAGTVVAGLYGTLTIRPDGSYSYALNNDHPDVQALRQASDLLLERFTYTQSDGSLNDSAEIIVLISGRNDAPVAHDDSAVAIEAGGLNNGVPGVDPSGNVLSNDTDVDSAANGETRAVSSVRTGSEAGSGTAGTLGSELRGLYGWLTLNADGSYSYRLDNAMAAVQALRDGDSLSEAFSYTVIDAAGAEDRATLTITILGRNDTPMAQNDSATAIEAGGLNNTTAGLNPSGNVLANDLDVDGNGERLNVVGVRHGGTLGVIGSALAGNYGHLTLDANGNYSYVVDNGNPRVQALRTSNDVLRETFTYQVRDLAGATSSATLTITLRGANDNPLAVDDTAVAVEAGGTGNGTSGVDPSGNVLANDRDVDANDSKTVTGIRTGAEAATGAFTAIGGGLSINGLYGTLTIAADGSYRYVLDNSLASVQALKPGDALVETFTYRMRDTAGASDNAQLTIRIDGAWDAPVATNDVAVAVADNGHGNSVNPTRNVLENDTDVDRGDALRVTGIRVGTEAAGGTLVSVNAATSHVNGTVVDGLYGQLIIGADGSYTYVVDSNNPTVRALGPTQFLHERFTYQVTDLGGLNDQAEIHIIVRGRNEAPVATSDSAVAVEAGGVNNTTPGVDPSGNVLANDRDADGDPLTVTAIRTGGLTESGAAGTLGTVLRGRYGDLVLNADGSWYYRLDNSLAEVQALRVSGQTLTEVFTYTIADAFDVTATAELRITIDGRNDAPVAVDDQGVAVEAGGVGNGTPGRDASGNVLDNDSDVDSVANGESKQVLEVRGENGQSALAGQVLVGRYGQLLLNADGSYSYRIDNANPEVQALRHAGETLRETFTYRMRDTAGATSEARLTVVIQGANDAPVARDDSAVASDQVPAPQTRGNVLPNDSDVDGNDALHVSAIRTGAEAASGVAGVVGQPIKGLYGTLVINADGSYSYTIDLSNPQVLAAAGLGQVLRDVFTYTVQDLAGATDQAELVIHLNIASPFIPAPAGDNFEVLRNTRQPGPALFDRTPAVFITPVVERADEQLEISEWAADGSRIRLASVAQVQSESLAAGLGLVPGQFVAQAVRESRLDSEQDLAWILGRESRTDLSADGLLSAPSLFSPDARDMTHNPAHATPAPEQRAGNGFSAQLRNAAERLRKGSRG